MKTINTILKILLSFIILMPIAGALGIFPPPTPDLYNTPEAFAFIQMIVMGGYIAYINAIVFAISFVLLWTNRVALAALLILPITVNVVGFHLFLDGGLFTAGALLGNIMLAINVYFLWQHRAMYFPLLKRSN
jgi:hypothetical protein